MKRLKLGDFELLWLNGGRFELDGGAMFGVVPRILWEKRYPPNEDNLITLVAYPILVKTPDTLILIETGLGNKLTEKQRKIFRVQEEWSVVEDLKSLGIEREDIDFVVLTHYDFDHSGGVVMMEDGSLSLTFPRARHIIQRSEWEDVLNPNRRSINTFWAINYEKLSESDKLGLIDGEEEIAGGVRVGHTGGHNRGHQIVVLESAGEKAIHMGDLLPTHIHYNPLWIMAYDNFPLEVIEKKAELEETALRDGAWMTFYHDPFVLSAKFDDKGNVVERLEA